MQKYYWLLTRGYLVVMFLSSCIFILLLLAENAVHIRNDVVWKGDGSPLKKWKIYPSAFYHRYDWGEVMEKFAYFAVIMILISLFAALWVVTLLELIQTWFPHN